MKKTIIAFSLLLGMQVIAGAAETPRRVIPTVTFLVKTFSEQENLLLEAVESKNEATVQKLIADRFEMRQANTPGTPVPRDDFIKKLMTEPVAGSSVSQMSAREFGDLVEVSFQWDIQPGADDGLGSRIFVVDTWKRNDGNWQMMARYAAQVGEAGKRVPGSVPGVSNSKKKI